MIKILVKNTTGSSTVKAGMTELGLIFFESGEISSVTAEKAKGHSISKQEEIIEPTPVRSEPVKKAKKKG